MKSRKHNRTVLGHIEADIMQHLTTSDSLISILLSARSSSAYYREAHKRARVRYQYKKSIEGLQARSLIGRRDDALHITHKGKELLEFISSRSLQQGSHWNGHWWLVMYDIPVSHNRYRFELRRMLVRAGFRKLQQSVWIHPHQNQELGAFLKDSPEISKFVRHVEVLPFNHLRTIEDWKKLSRS